MQFYGGCILFLNLSTERKQTQRQIILHLAADVLECAQKRPFLGLFEFVKKIYFIVFQNSINGVSFETLIVR